MKKWMPAVLAAVLILLSACSSDEPSQSSELASVEESLSTSSESSSQSSESSSESSASEAPVSHDKAMEYAMRGITEYTKGWEDFSPVGLKEDQKEIGGTLYYLIMFGNDVQDNQYELGWFAVSSQDGTFYLYDEATGNLLPAEGADENRELTIDEVLPAMYRLVAEYLGDRAEDVELVIAPGDEFLQDGETCYSFFATDGMEEDAEPLGGFAVNADVTRFYKQNALGEFDFLYEVQG